LQVGIVPVNEDQRRYAETIAQQLEQEGIRVEVNAEPVHFNKRMKGFLGQRVPVVLIVGEKERNDYTVTMRKRDEKEQETMTMVNAVAKLKKLAFYKQ
jgi:threonyl-tRNA synthetase